MRLWSVVVSQPSTPGRSAQMRSEALDARALRRRVDDGHRQRRLSR